MKIGINASFLRKPDSGIGQVTVNFIRTLGEICRESGYGKDDTFILYLEEDSDLTLPENFSKRVFLPPYRRDDLIRKIWWEKFLLPKKIKEDGCNVFLSLYQSTTIIKDVPHTMLVHDAIWKIFPEYTNNNRKKIYYSQVDAAIAKASRILTVSNHSKKDILKHFQLDPQTVKAEHIDCSPVFKQPVHPRLVESIRQKYEIENDYIFYIGGFDVRKNVGRIIDAYGILLKKNQNIPDLVIAGSFHPHLVPLVTDIPKKVKAILQAADAPEEKVKLIGFVPQEDVPALYRGARLFCYPSLYEGFGIPILEAFNCGCPVVTSDLTSIKEIADDQCALIVDATDTEAIAKAMEKGIIDQQLRARLMEKSKEKAGQFQWRRFTQNTLDLLHSLQ